MKKSLVLVLVAVTMLGISAVAQWSATDSISDVKLYWQPASTVEFDPACPYIYVMPDINPEVAVKTWVLNHVTTDGALRRPTTIGMDALDVLDVFFGQNDMIAFWHQIKNFGPIKDIQTLSKIMTVSRTRDNAEPAWTCSLGEVLQLVPFFALEMGTSDGNLPDRYQQ